MGEHTKIAWTDHTFNGWIGCAKVSAGCANCYAEADMDVRRGRAKWGLTGSRSLTSDDNWSKPHGWNRAAAKAGERRRVFAHSLSDVFENWPGQLVNHKGERLWWHFTDPDLKPYVCQDRAGMLPGNPHPDWRPYTLEQARERLWRLIAATPNLDWLLLTKRPERWRKCWPLVPVKGHVSQNEGDGKTWQTFRNVWIGTSVENQATADERIPVLREIPAKVRFLSMEPLLEAVDLTRTAWQFSRDACRWFDGVESLTANGKEYQRGLIHWVIVGGESGPKARPFDISAALRLRDQCKVAGVAFFLKQLGSHPIFGPPYDNGPAPRHEDGAQGDWRMTADKHGADWTEWPESWRVREFPQ